MNIEAEQLLLSAILTKNSLVYSIASKLKPEHFIEPVHQQLYARVLQGVMDRQESVSIVNLKSWAENNQILRELVPDNPVKYLVNLIGMNVLVDVEELAEIILRSWMLNKIKESAKNLSDIASVPDADPDAVLGKIHSELLSIRSGGTESSIDSKALTERIINKMDIDLPIDSTGLAKLDALMGGGLIQGKMYGFFARKKVGKTSFATTIAHNLEIMGIKHSFICGEMGEEEVHERFLSRLMGVHTSAFRDSGYRKSKHFREKIADAHDKLKGYTRYYDAAGMTFDSLKGMVSESRYRYGVNGVIVDYLQLVGGKPSRMSDAAHLDAVSQWLADAAKKYKIWILVLGQINQDGNTRGGEGIRLACDMCLELHREDLSDNTGWIEMKDTRYTRWANLGSKENPAVIMREHGQYFEEL